MKHHTDLLNCIAKRIKAKDYLEIGVQNRENNFDAIEINYKIGVDPAVAGDDLLSFTSDKFFQLNKDTWDLIFIDGLHHADQVKRDISSGWQTLNAGGVIVVHDCNPHSERITHVPRDSKEWTGNVYKTICQIQSPKFTVDFDYGCCVLRKGHEPLEFLNQEFNWDEFDVFRKELLKLVCVEEAVKIIEAWT